MFYFRVSVLISKSNFNIWIAINITLIFLIDQNIWYYDWVRSRFKDISVDVNCTINFRSQNVSETISSKMASLGKVTRAFGQITRNLSKSNYTGHAFAVTRCMSTGMKPNSANMFEWHSNINTFYGYKLEGHQLCHEFSRQYML